MRALAITAVLAACGSSGGGGGDRIDVLARQVPASAQAVLAIDGGRLRGTWLVGSARAVRALVPADRGCLIDVALAADRALVAELAAGRMLVVATAKPATECRALSQIGPGVWLATLDGATAPAAGEPRLTDRPDFAELARLLDAPVAAVAPDGISTAGVVVASAAITSAVHGTLSVELDSPEHAEAAERWLRDQLAVAATVLGDAGAIARAVTIARTGVVVTATFATDATTAARDGPVALIATVAALAARQAPPASTAPTCLATSWPVACSDGLRYEIPGSLRATIEAAVRAAKPTPRVEGGQPAGVRLGTLPADGVLAALGLRTGDAVIAIEGRKLDTREAVDDLAARLRTADRLAITIDRGPATFELTYVVKP